MLGGNGEREEKEGKGGREEEQRGEEGWERKRGERGKRGGEITLYQILDKKTKFFAGLLKCLPSCYNYYKLLLLAIEVTLQLLETFKVSCFALCSGILESIPSTDHTATLSQDLPVQVQHRGLGGLSHLPPKFEHIFVAVITSPPFLLCRYFYTSLLLIVCALR